MGNHISGWEPGGGGIQQVARVRTDRHRRQQLVAFGRLPGDADRLPPSPGMNRDHGGNVQALPAHAVGCAGFGVHTPQAVELGRTLGGGGVGRNSARVAAVNAREVRAGLGCVNKAFLRSGKEGGGGGGWMEGVCLLESV